MVLTARLSDADLQAIADEALGRTLSAIGTRRVVAGSGRDHDGDPAVFVSVSMPTGSSIIPPRILATARVALAKALEQQGDDRLAYISVDWPDDEVPPSPDVPT